MAVPSFRKSYLSLLIFVVGERATTNEEVVRIVGLLRGTESAVQAVSYGLNSVPIFADMAGVYLNFGLWALAPLPRWLVVSGIGVSLGDRKVEMEGDGLGDTELTDDDQK